MPGFRAARDAVSRRYAKEKGTHMERNRTLPLPYSVHETPDGFMVSGPHAQTPEESNDKGTVSSVYVIRHNRAACIVDTGRHEASYNALAAILRKHGLDVRYIILTHDHYDHVGNAERLRDAFGGEVLAHVLDRPLIEAPLSLYEADVMRRWYGVSMQEAWADMGFSDEAVAAMRKGAARLFNTPVIVDTYISEERHLDLAGLEVRLLHTPGHSPGSLSVHVPSKGTVYTGDLTFWVNPCRPYPIGNALNCVKSLERIRALCPVYCGHGHYLGVPAPDAWLKNIISRHHCLRDSILNLLDTPQTIAQLRKGIFPTDPPDSFPPIPENSIQAWLAALLQEKNVIRCGTDSSGACMFARGEHIRPISR